MLGAHALFININWYRKDKKGDKPAYSITESLGKLIRDVCSRIFEQHDCRDVKDKLGYRIVFTETVTTTVKEWPETLSMKTVSSFKPNSKTNLFEHARRIHSLLNSHLIQRRTVRHTRKRHK